MLIRFVMGNSRLSWGENGVLSESDHSAYLTARPNLSAPEKLFDHKFAWDQAQISGLRSARLLENSPAKHLTLEDFEPDLEECRLNRVEIVLKDHWIEQSREPCPDCGGTGKYVGLNLIETCVSCRGLGTR
jgi:hypothetical protein